VLFGKLQLLLGLSNAHRCNFLILLHSVFCVTFLSLPTSFVRLLSAVNVAFSSGMSVGVCVSPHLRLEALLDVFLALVFGNGHTSSGVTQIVFFGVFCVFCTSVMVGNKFDAHPG